MISVVTLHITACSGGANLSGAAVTDGISIVYTNAYGEVLVYFDDPVGYAVSVSKSGFVTRSVALYATQNGTTQTFCLDTAPAPPPPSGGGGGGISCFIVSAATGSPESETVVALRQLRDQVGARSAVAAVLIDAVYSQYWQFSPAVAKKIETNKLARQGALVAAIRPLLAWYQLAGHLGFDHRATRAVEDATKVLRDACPRWMSPSSLAELIAKIRRREPVPANAPRALRDLAPRLHQAAALPLVDWAMLRPLQTCWAIAADRLDPVAEIANWLADAPIDQMDALPAGDPAVHADAVGALLAFDPAAQRRLLDRLHAVFAKRARMPSTSPSPCGRKSDACDCPS
jgi:hypothetical protein